MVTSAEYRRICRLALIAATICCFGLVSRDVVAQIQPQVFIPESRELNLVNPNTLPSQPIAAYDVPNLPSQPNRLPAFNLTLDDAIRIAVENARVVRILGGQTAASSGRTIYDVASTQTLVEQQKAVFDPTLQLNQSVNQTDNPGAGIDPLNPLGAQFFGTQTESYNVDFALSKRTQLGGTASLNVNSNPTASEFGLAPPILNPSDRSAVSLNITQPLLRGGGRPANLAPLLVARIDTDRSFFQYKDSVQELVRGVVDAYWALVFARTDLWARENQVKQARWAMELTRARNDVGFDDLGTLSQAEVALLNFEATLLSSQSNVMQREEALRNILGLPLNDGYQIVPTTEPIRQEVTPEWNGLLELAEQNRPDIIELKLILEADQHLLVQARNQAQPSLDAVANYRWNGLEGTMRNGDIARTGGGQFTDWTLGVNFSVPLGLRQSRAGVRRQELLIARDRANLEQGIHAMIYNLSLNYRTLDLSHAQYELFQRSRVASSVNLDAQLQRYQANLVIFLNVLQAISDWGNAVSAEAQALTQYNTQLANLERQTGTVLEAHGIRFYEERFQFAGPMRQTMLYPTIVAPSLNAQRYGDSGRASEESFDLRAPALPSARPEIDKPQLVPEGGLPNGGIEPNVGPQNFNGPQTNRGRQSDPYASNSTHWSDPNRKNVDQFGRTLTQNTALPNTGSNFRLSSWEVSPSAGRQNVANANQYPSGPYGHQAGTAPSESHSYPVQGAVKENRTEQRLPQGRLNMPLTERTSANETLRPPVRERQTWNPNRW